MSGVRIERAGGVPMDKLRQGMVAAFVHYALPLTPSKNAFEFMMRQRGLSAADSLVAFDGDQVVAVWLVSVAESAGYLISSGTVPEHRGKGLARRMGQGCLDDLRARGVETFQTEVLVGNDVARGVYERLGMRVRRDFTCYSLSCDASEGGADVALWHEILPHAPGCRDWMPSWQHDDEALIRGGKDVLCVAVRDVDGLAGFAALLRPTGVVAQIAVRPDRRNEGIGRSMLAALARAQGDGALRVLNVQKDDGGFARFMQRMGAVPTIGQHEMICRV